jgi:hypothetical protein
METESTTSQTPSRRGAVKVPTTVPLFQRIIRLFYRFILLVLLVLLVVIAGGAYLLGRASVYNQYPQLHNIETANETLSKVAQLIQLPQNETPSMVTVDDASAVKKEPFLSNAINNDILIVYPGAGMAILYRPATNKLINVGPVNTQATTNSDDTRSAKDSQAESEPIISATTHGTTSSTTQ